MVRILGFLVGIFFSGMLLISFILGLIADAPVVAENHAFVAPTAEQWVKKQFPERDVEWSFSGPLGKYDTKQLQRGFQVYSEVCSACHSLKLVAFRDLKDLGYNDAEIKAIAKKRQIADINPKTGEAATRPGTPADHFPLVYPNDTAARAANNNAIPPDQSLLAKSREGGPTYIYNLLTGYQNQPAELLKAFPDAKTPTGLHFNPYFPNLNLAMAPPLAADGQVTYGPGNPKPTVDQMAKDVSAFLMWAAEPKLEARHSTGLAVVVFLLFATVLSWLSYRSIWADKEH